MALLNVDLNGPGAIGLDRLAVADAYLVGCCFSDSSGCASVDEVSIGVDDGVLAQGRSC